MKNKIVLGIFVLAFGFVLGGCTTRLGSFTVISTKNIDWSRVAEFTRQNHNNRVSGEDKCDILIFIPTKFNVSIEEAVDKALKKIPGGIALIDVVLKYTFFSLLFYSSYGYLIEGSVLVDPQLVSADEQAEAKYLVFYTPDGSQFIREEVTKEEFNNYL